MEIIATATRKPGTPVRSAQRVAAWRARQRAEQVALPPAVTPGPDAT